MTNVVFLPSLVYFVFFLQPGQWPESWWGKRVKSLIAIVLELCSLAFFLDFLTTALELIPGGLFANLSCRIVHSTFFFVTSFQVHSFFFFLWEVELEWWFLAHMYIFFSFMDPNMFKTNMLVLWLWNIFANSKSPE